MMGIQVEQTLESVQGEIYVKPSKKARDLLQFIKVNGNYVGKTV